MLRFPTSHKQGHSSKDDNMTKKSNELIKVNFDKQICDAREVHKFLQSSWQFSKWIKFRIEEYGFIEGKDFIKTFSHTGLKLGRPKVIYNVTIAMAKELAMVERTEKGSEVRKYFLKVESDYKAMLARRTIPAWQTSRIENKGHNKEFNEIIQKFQEYAALSGSQNSNRYYSLFNDMINHNLFEFPKGLKNIPDKLEAFQHSFSNSAKKVVIELIKNGIEKSIHYKEIFVQCKNKVIEVAKVLGVTPVPIIENPQLKLIK